jgi:hypothetical protein
MKGPILKSRWSRSTVAVALAVVFVTQAVPTASRRPVRETTERWLNGVAAGALVVALVAAVVQIVLNNLEDRRHRRAARGLCPACGYSLRGNVSGVCPECGTPVEMR